MTVKRFGRNRSVGRHGSSATAASPKSVMPPQKMETKTVPVKSLPGEGEDASIGLSISLGQSAEYGKAKYEVSVWCTLPSGVGGEDRSEKMREVQEWVFKEADSIRADLVADFGLPFSA